MNPLTKMAIALLATAVVIGLTYLYVKARESVKEHREWSADERKKRKDPDEIFTRWVADFEAQPFSVMRDGTKRI